MEVTYKKRITPEEALGLPFFFVTKEDLMQEKITHVVDSTDFVTQTLKFHEQYDGDTEGNRIGFETSKFSIRSLIEHIKQAVKKRCVFQCTDIYGDAPIVASTRFVVFDHKDAMIASGLIYVNNRPRDSSTVGPIRGYVSVIGNPAIVDVIGQAVSEIGIEKKPEIVWHYIADGRHNVASVNVMSEYKLHDEYYPFIAGGVDAFIDDYLKSPESILVLLGPPGTGKSSLLRHMIMEKSLRAAVTYDEQLLRQDRLFIDHLIGEHTSDVLILEDADVLLQSRDASDNKIMNKLLNISDGIVKVFEKKIIFTTNLSSTDSIDDALIRPGRCYGVVQFRKLTFNEAVAAATVAGITPPKIEQRYSLAELFCDKRNIDGKSFATKKIGF